MASESQGSELAGLDRTAFPRTQLKAWLQHAPRRYDHGKAVEYRVRRFPDKPMSDHGLHAWWYGCLQRAGIVAPRDDDR